MTYLPAPDPQDVLRVPGPPAPGARAHALVAGRRVLVTGAAGTVGGAVVRLLHTLRPAAVHLLDVDARGLHTLRVTLAAAGVEAPVHLVDVRDARALDAAVGRAEPDLVVHAAAPAHRALLEDAACAGVTAHVWGTESVVRTAERHGVPRLVHVSGADAAAPTTVLGAAQRLAEQVVHGADLPVAASVRLRTVLGGAGSLWETLLHQVAAGLPVTLPETLPPLLTPAEAAAHLLDVAALADRGGTYVVDAGRSVAPGELVRRCAAAVGVRGPRVVTVAPPHEPQVLTGADEHPRPTAREGVGWCPPPTAPPGFERSLAELYAAADDADDARVRDLLAQRFAGLGRDGDDHVPRDGARPVLRLVRAVPA